MASPDKILIPLDDDRCENVGRLPDGTQFMAYVTGAYPGGDQYPGADSGLLHQKRWLAVIHQFDPDGNHIKSETRLGGFQREGRDIAGEKAGECLEEMYATLMQQGEPDYGDIWVKLFSVEIDGVVHGLFYEQSEENPEVDWVLLEPCDIMFHPPWDSGDYST